MRINQLLLIALTAAGFGCAKTVIVVDPASHPIQGATVLPETASMNGPATTTDTNGKASIPSQVGPQPVQWITINKPGYEPAHIPAPATWPLHVTLTPTPTATKRD